MSEITVAGVASDFWVSDEFVEVEFAAGEASIGGASYKAILIGNKLSTGSATVTTVYGPDTVVPCRNLTDVATLFGEGSELYRMAKRFMSVNPSTPLYMIAATEASGARATATITFTGTATKPGTAEVRASDEVFGVGFATGDGYEDVAEAVADAVNGRAGLPFTAAANAGVVTLTARQIGTRGNAYRHMARILEASTGITVTPGSVTAFSGGTGTDDISDVLTELEGSRFYYMVSAANDASNLSDLAAHITTQALAANKCRVKGYAGSTGSVASLNSLATGVNDERVDILGFVEWDGGGVEAVAHWVGCKSFEEAAFSADSLNFCKYGSRPGDLWSLRRPNSGYKPTATELNSLLQNGVTPVQVFDNGQTAINRAVTTLSLSGSNPETRVKDSHIVLVCDKFADDLVVKLAAQFGGKLLNENPPKGQSAKQNTATPEIIAASVKRLVDEYAGRALVRKEAVTKASMEVSLSATPGRVGIRVPLYVALILAQIVSKVDQVG